MFVGDIPPFQTKGKLAEELPTKLNHPQGGKLLSRPKQFFK